MKSATDERNWGFKGKQVLGPPVKVEDLRARIVAGCECWGCKANREWIERHYGTKAVQEPVCAVCAVKAVDVVGADEVRDLPPAKPRPVLVRDDQTLLAM